MQQQKTIRARGRESEGSQSAVESKRSVQPPPNPLLKLQRTIGNRAVQRMVQAKSNENELAIEREGQAPFTSAFDIDAVLRSPGGALDSGTREFMEAGFGYDFSSVRVHNDTAAADSSRSIDANAYTIGQDVVFGAGKYSPGSSEGRRLIAHELTHVVQQSSSAAAAPGLSDGELAISEPSDDSEQIAESSASDIMSGGALGQAVGESPGAAAVQRDEDEGWLDKIGGAISDAGSAVASGVGSVASDVGDVAGEAWQGAKSVAGDVAGGVSDVAGDAWQGAKSVASDVAGGVSDVAGDVWQGAKSVAGGVSDVAGEAWQGVKGAAGDVADFGKEVYGQMKTDAGYVQKGVGAVGSGIDWLEGEAKSGTSWLADKAEGIPVLSQVANAGKSYVDFNVDVLGGAAKGVTGLAGGILSAAADPVDTAKGLYTMSEHIPGLGMPQKLLGGAYDLATGKSLSDVADETLNPMSDAKYWGNVGKGLLSPYAQAIAEGKPGEALGRAGVDIGSLLTGAGEAADAAKVAEVADAAKVADVADAAKVADVADASKVADVTDAGKAAGVPAEPVQVPVDPNVNPTGPTQLPPGPTELPPHPPLSPDYLENPTIPKPPKLPEEFTVPTEEVPAAPSSVAGPEETAGSVSSPPGEATSVPATSEADIDQMVREVQGGRNARVRAQSPYRDIKLDALKEEIEGGIRSPDTEMLAQDRGQNVPVEISEGETTLGEAQVNVHHKTSLAEDPTQAASEENLELLDAQGGGSAHKAGAHGNEFAKQRGGLAADPTFDENLGMSADQRRVVDSATGKNVPGLEKSPESNLTLEEQSNITARPQERSLEDILNEQSVHNSPEDELIDRIDSSSDFDDDFDND
jgi:Domain of unknown function (DUF4157)